MQTLKSNSPPVINDFLQQNKLSAILQKAQLLQDLQQWLSKVEPELSQHCRVANIKANELIVEVDSAAWGMRLKFLSSELLKALQGISKIGSLQKISYFIQPPEINRTVNYWPRPTISNEAATSLAAAAMDIADPALKTALLKLAKLG